MCHLPSPFFHGRLRSKQIESACFSGTAAFMEVRIQSVVVEFILNHVDVLFSTKLSTLIREGAGTYRHQTDKYSSFITHCFFYITCVAVLPHYQVTTHCHGPSHCWFHRLPLNFWVWRRPRPGLRLRSTLLSLKTASTLRWAKVQLPCRANSTQSSSFPLKGLLTLYYVVIKTLTDCTYLKNVSYRTRNNIAAMCHPLLVTCKTASVWFPDTASNFGKKWIQSYFTHRVCISKDPLFRFLHKLTELFFFINRKRPPIKSKKSPVGSWRSFFNLGKSSSMSKRKLHRNPSEPNELKAMALAGESFFHRWNEDSFTCAVRRTRWLLRLVSQYVSGGRGDTATLRSAKSEESLSSLHNVEGNYFGLT